jgi:hypothetical protein
MNTTSKSRPTTQYTEASKDTNIAVPVLRYFAAGLGIVAGVIHLAVAPDHFQEAFEFGAFFVVVGVFQIVSSLILAVRPSRMLVIVTMAFNALVVIIYTVAYTVGLPFGPNPGEPEKVNGLGSASTLGELALLVLLIGVLIALLRRGGFRQPPRTNPV